MAPKKPRVSCSSRAGIIFPVARMHRYLKAAPSTTARVTKGAAIYLASVAEYLVGRCIKYFIPKLPSILSLAELLELGGNAARDNRRTRIIPRHLLLAIASDDELNKVK
jgi:histone H2A